MIDPSSLALRYAQLKEADLYPSLGYPGGPCQVIERIDLEVKNPKLREKLVDEVEVGNSLSNAAANKIYDLESENGPAGTKFKKFFITPHAQYRMDLRGVNVSDLRLFFKRFQKAWSDSRSQQGAEAKRWEADMSWKVPINWTDSEGLTVVFEVAGRAARIITVYWRGVSDPRPVDESACALPSRVASRHREAGIADLWAKWIAQPYSVIKKHHKEFVTGPVDDAMDVIIKELAPELVRLIGETEVDADVDEFLDGSIRGKWDLERGLYADPPRSETEDFREGYSWGYNNPEKVTTADLPPEVKRQVVQEALTEFRGRVTEEVFRRALQKAWGALSPVTTFRAIMAAVKRYGWKLGVVIALIEITETFIIPAAVVALTGKPELSVVGMLPLSEILYAVVFRLLGNVPSEANEFDADGHLDWYESKYGPVRMASSGGDCYEANGREFMELSLNSRVRLVHGEVTGQGPLEGVNYGHAWIEDGNTVLDFSNGRTVRVPKPLYYAIGGIDRNDNYHVYDSKKFQDRITRFETWGPWDLKTSTGL